MKDAYGNPIYGRPLGTSGQKAVTTAGTQLQVSEASVKCAGVLVRAIPGNTGVVYIGGADVSASTGLALKNTDPAVFIPVADLNLLWVDSASNGDGISYLTY